MHKPRFKKNSKLPFLKRITTRYKVSIINENTLEETGNLKLSALGLSLSVFLLIGVTLVVFSVIVLYTPLRNLLPEHIDDNVRVQVVEDAIKVDSLTTVVQLQNDYIDVLKGIISGDVKLDTTDTETSKLIVAKREELLMEKSEAEKEFAANFEEAEKYNIANRTQSENSIMFFRPAAGIITQEFNPVSGSYGIEITTSPDASVSAAYKGLVFNVGYDFSHGYYVEIAHPNNFISIYKGLEIIFVKSGMEVKTGQVLGTVYDTDPDTKPMVHFELWNNTQPQNPMNYIVFE